MQRLRGALGAARPWTGLGSTGSSAAEIVSRETTAGAPPIAGALGQVRWATKTAGGSTKNGRDSHPKYLGMKVSDGQLVTRPGVQIFRQRGLRHHPGFGVRRARDDTIVSAIPGRVRYAFDHKKKKRTISIEPLDVVVPQLTKEAPDARRFRIDYRAVDDYLQGVRGDSRRIPSGALPY
ncbi:unnamed protein product [Pedinophyceae sp. YPF-701]|nr:unnamed protein product [Pedinophyceae sp. YPF-701]